MLQAALGRLGLSSVRVDWANPDIDWSKFHCAVFRTTWDYFDRFAEFTPWLDRVETQTRLLNLPSTVRWNMDKHYLADLAAKDISIVESTFLEAGGEADLSQILARTGWSNAIVKPCISGGARHTYRLNPDNAESVGATIRPLLAKEAFIVQPFQDDILETGEDTLMVFQGKFSHAIRKTAKAGDFRVQDDFGGTVHDYKATLEQIELAERAFAVCRPLPLYGRVDMVRDNRGRNAIMELELIEPELWLRKHPQSATAFAEAIAGELADRWAI